MSELLSGEDTYDQRLEQINELESRTRRVARLKICERIVREAKTGLALAPLIAAAVEGQKLTEHMNAQQRFFYFFLSAASSAAVWGGFNDLEQSIARSAYYKSKEARPLAEELNVPLPPVMRRAIER